jgi:hypothetical protein
LQVLEGESKAVHHTFDRIKHDPRHDHVTLLLDEAIEEKTFSHWNMGFKQLQREDLAKFAAYAEYFEDDFSHIKAQPKLALEILKTFS